VVEGCTTLLRAQRLFNGVYNFFHRGTQFKHCLQKVSTLDLVRKLTKNVRKTHFQVIKTLQNFFLPHRLPRNNSDPNTVKRVTDQMAILRGSRPMLKDFLINELCAVGWDDKIRLLCRNEISKSNGLISVDNLVDKVTPQARKEIPDELKREMILKIKAVLLKANP
jgi:hypothetical protein